MTAPATGMIEFDKVSIVFGSDPLGAEERGYQRLELEYPTPMPWMPKGNRSRSGSTTGWPFRGASRCARGRRSPSWSSWTAVRRF